MKTTRKLYSAEFKDKVALEAIRGDVTLAELAAKHGVHHTMIADWKRQEIDGIAGAYKHQRIVPAGHCVSDLAKPPSGVTSK